MLKEIIRNKKNRPMSFFVNWLGLTLGFLVAIVIYLYIMGELRHDRYNFTESMDRVYRVEMGSTDMGAITASALGPFIEQMPEAEAVARLFENVSRIQTKGLANEQKMKLGVLFADSTFFSIFPYKVVEGSLTDAIGAIDRAVVSESAAKRLFGTTSVVGQMLAINDSLPLTITAVVADVEPNSRFSPDVICNLYLLMPLWHSEGRMFEDWGWWNYETYVKFRQGVDVKAFEQKYRSALFARLNDEWKRDDMQKELSAACIRSFDDTYFATELAHSMGKTTDRRSLSIMAILAVLILVVAIINYVNIYTARSTEVVRAMGVKAIMGARRGGLIAFVIADAVAVAMLSAVFAYGIATLLTPLYPAIIGTELVFDLTPDVLVVLFLALPAVCGVLAGFFPALSLTRYPPLQAISARNGGRRMEVVRNVLTVLQFTISIALIASTLYINRQMRYMNEVDLGYNRENIVAVDGSDFMYGKFSTFRTALMQDPKILNASFCSESPISVDMLQTVKYGDKEDQSPTVCRLGTDENILDVLGLRLVEGDSLTAARIETMSYQDCYINETLAEQIRRDFPDVTFPYRNFLGVVSDYQFKSLTSSVTPLTLASKRYGSFGGAYIKIAAGNLDESLAYIERTFKQVFPSAIYEFSFLDDQFGAMYRTEQLFRARLLTFSLIAIFISCIGLFALIGYSVERRSKEIAIRKVYGSSVSQILMMFSLGFLRWLIIAFVIAVPAVWWMMSEWVSAYAYRAPIEWWIFAVALGVTFIVAILTIVGQAYRAATTNPAKAVKG